MIEVKKSIYKNLGLTPETIFAKKWGNKPAITIDELLDALFIAHSSPKAMNLLGRSEKTFIGNIKKLFPNISLTGGGESWEHWFIKQSDYKKCSSCKSFLLKNSFSQDRSSADNYYHQCKACRQISNKDWYAKNKNYHEQYLIDNRASFNARNAKRRALLLKRTVQWSDELAILKFYEDCPKGHHVDHYYPLQGENVCGLHVLDNLQYLTAEANLSKGNKLPEEFGGMAKLVETRQT